MNNRRLLALMLWASLSVQGAHAHDANETSKDDWYAGSEQLWLDRDYGSNIQFARTVSQAGDPLALDTIQLTDVDSDSYEPGLRLRLGKHLTDDLTAELTLFGDQDWSDAKSLLVQDPPFAQSPFIGNHIPFGNKGFDTFITVRYGSEVHSAEFNLKRKLRESEWTPTVLAGFRYFRLEEDLDVFGLEQFTNSIERTTQRATNNLYGFQVGGELAKSCKDTRLGVVLSGKAGLFLNRAGQSIRSDTRFTTGALRTTALVADGSDTDLAGMLEAGVIGTAKITSRWKVRAGYQMLYVDGLALAPDQLVRTGSSLRDLPGIQFPAGLGTGIRTSGDLFLHGPSIGSEIRF